MASMPSRRRRDLKSLTLTLTYVFVLFCHVQSQDVGSFLAGLLGASEVPKNESNSDQPQLPCPGECVHALTSILCSKVVEQFQCGASYLRCCVSSDFNFGTVVETSAPFPEESSTETTAEYNVYLLTTQADQNTASNNPQQTSQPLPSALPPTASQTVTPQTIQTTRKPRPCPGICVENIFVQYCSGTLPEGQCERGTTCCSSNQDEEPQQVPPTTTYKPVTRPNDKHIHENPEPIQNAVTPEPSTLPPSPPCPGSCVAPLFSLLCDAVNENYYCANDGRCCISNDEVETEPPTADAVPLESDIPCPGACIPTFLQDMCNYPSEIIPETGCEGDFICCHQPDLKDHLHVDAPQIPLLRPISSQPEYQAIPLGAQNNVPHIRPPPIPHPYPQRPQVPPVGKPLPPLIVPHIHNQAGGNQGYIAAGYPGYVVAPQVPSSDNGPVVKPSYPQNVNYGNNPYQQQHFPHGSERINIGIENQQPVRLTVMAPHSPHISPHEEEQNSYNFDRRKPNITHIPIRNPSDYLPNKPASENEPLRIISSASSSQSQQASEFTNKQNQHNSHDRFVNSNIGIAPDNLRPIPVGFHQKPPTLEKFHPPPSSEFSQPVIPPPSGAPNASTIIVLHMTKPTGQVDTVHEIVPQAQEPMKTTYVPYQESFRPIPSQRPLKPHPQSSSVQKTATLSPEIEPVHMFEESILSSSDINSESVKAEQNKKVKPACPGSCIAPFLRFTCFGNNAIYDGFACEQEGTMCCTSVEHIEKYEEHLKTGNALVLVKPDSGSKTDATDDTSRRPGMYVCGIKGNQRRKTARVVGGKTAAPGEWCWQVALINAKNQYLCGGALIGSRWVLTAAHCITSLVRNGEAIYVRVGDFDLASQYGSPGAQTQKVSTSYIHHNHNGQTLDNDIALLRLENPVQLQESVCLVCLPARGAESQPGKRCTVTGYGYMSETGPIALKIREAELPIVEEKLCTEQVNKVTEKRFILPAGSFCAGGEAGNDACQGDGGGPLTCENEGYYELTGLVSWGFGCGKENVPGVYVKVSSYIGWINQIISVNN